MIKATINGKKEFSIDKDTINGEEYQWDMVNLGNGNYHIIKDGHSYNATIVNINKEDKTMTITVNGNQYEISIKDKYDILLQQMGITAGAATKINNFKAPMPGLIREILFSEGATVKKGDILLILEAMKMENALKSPRDGTIKKIHITTGIAVEKGQVLIDFE
jgi:biotin carboxyl carrier protein